MPLAAVSVNVIAVAGEERNVVEAVKPTPEVVVVTGAEIDVPVSSVSVPPPVAVMVN